MVPLLTNLGLRDLNTTQGLGITLEKTYEKLATRTLQWQLGNAVVLEREDTSG
jgi:hypothetical protein